jgi:hypothetical protein
MQQQNQYGSKGPQMPAQQEYSAHQPSNATRSARCVTAVFEWWFIVESCFAVVVAATCVHFRIAYFFARPAGDKVPKPADAQEEPDRNIGLKFEQMTRIATDVSIHLLLPLAL